MSDNWMIVIAADPFAKPSRERADAALEVLTALRPKAEEIELCLSDTPQFFDCGGNFEGVFCPFCQADIQDWWGGALNRWSQSEDESSLSVEVPCCGRTTSLNDLDYVWPQGLACIGIELMNPGPDLEPEERREVEAALGIKVRVIWRHI
ncbi:MAG TPA: hypothetical protein VKV77_14570 [Methylovirgula sp.]|nr:hypothetical protein [Methylovirgula sp.]